ncbi:alpha/beta fold hydrolase [Leekyejoonella antrihumi]|uniref:Alpha/beta fold hydrolase n=1 Tax=Leekyejoonella antrihumi TaxID=1660198 RepID=A0A563DUR1_9MICO|nr:alpha/beta fold hydrolase [Leekyejoonella antrihumi]TWP33673.1 alpha/beta fold hydrolase [Leekyejoonella antrihumi]
MPLGRGVQTFTRDDLTFDVTDSGPAEGEVVVLLHGFPQDRTAWDSVTPALNAAGLRTLAPDQRGYSPGARPRSRTAYTMEELSADTLALLDAAGAKRAHLVGHDWGGALAWALADRHPDRVASLTALSTPHPAAMGWAFTHGDQWKKSWYMVFFQLPWLPERAVARGLHDLYTHHGVAAEQAAKYVARFNNPQELRGPLGWYRSMPASRSMKRSLASLRKGRSAGASQPRRITVPTTFIWGSRDFALGRAAAEKTREFVCGDYEFIELDESHWLPEVVPDVVAEAVLQRVRSVGR